MSDYLKKYNSLSKAETSGEKNPWIRTRVIPKGGSTAYGPVQITRGKAIDYATRANQTGLSKESVDFVNNVLVPMQDKMNKYGGKDMKPGFEAYDYGGTGDFQEEHKEAYKKLAIEMIKYDWERSGKNDDVFLKIWRGTEPEKEYIKRYKDELHSSLNPQQLKWGELLQKVFGDSEAYAGELEFDLSRSIPVDGENNITPVSFDISRAVPVRDDVPQMRELPADYEMRSLTAEEKQMDFDYSVNRFAEQLVTASTGLTPEQAELGKKKFEKAISLPVSAVLMGPLYAMGFEIYRQGKSAVVSAIKDEKYSPLEQRMLSELIPEDTNKWIKGSAYVGEALSDIAIVAGVSSLAKQGTLKNTLEIIGKKLEKAGYGTGKVTITKEAIKEAAKGTTLEQNAKAWVQAKMWQPKPADAAKVPAKIGAAPAPVVPAIGAVTPIDTQSRQAVAEGKVEIGKSVDVYEKGLDSGKIIDIKTNEGGQEIFTVLMEGESSPIEMLREGFELSPPTEGKDIDTQAQKAVADGKSLEEFVGNFVFHGQGATHPRKGAETITGGVTKNLKGAQAYAGYRGEGNARTEEGGVIRVIRISDLTPEQQEIIKSGGNISAMDFGQQVKPIATFNVETAESQLTAAYEKAKGEIPSEPIQTIQEKPKPKFKEPSPARLFTSQSRYAELLGVKKIVEPLELGKQAKDIEFTKIAHQIDTAAKIVRKSGMKEEEMAVILNINEDKPKGLTEEQGKAFDYFRSLTRDLFTRMNEVRAEMDMPLIPYQKGYFRHMAEQKVQDILSGKDDIPSMIKDKVVLVQKGIDNPMAIQRKMEDLLLEYFKSDLRGVMKATASTALNEIHLANPLKMFQDSMKENLEYLPKSTKNWIEGYVNEAILKKQTELDASFDRMIPSKKIADAVNVVLKHFGKQVSDVSLSETLSAISKLPIYGAMSGINPKQLIRNKFQRVQDMALYGPKYTAMGSLPTKEYPVLEELKTKSEFLKSYSGFEEIPVSSLGKIEKLSLAPYHWTAVTNVSSSMNSAYHWTSNKITNPKNKDLGWADPQRTYTEPEGFFYPSEKETLLKEMEYGAHTSHYSYTGIGMPEIFRYKIGKPFTRLMSWWMNHFFMFHREASTRAFSGHTGYDTSKIIPIGDRINYIKYLVIGGAILTAMGYDKSFFLGVAPQSVAPTGQLMLGLYKYFTNLGDEPYQKRKRTEASYQIKSSALIHIPGYLFYKNTKEFLETKDWMSLFFYKKKSKKVKWISK